MPYQTKYLFVRTETTFENERRSLEPLCAELDSPVRTISYGGALIWTDGAVIKFVSKDTCSEDSQRLLAHLRDFEAWSIHDAFGDCSESFSGTVGKYNREHSASAECAQVFVRYAQRDIDTDEVLLNFHRELREPFQRVFHLKSGCVLLTHPQQPLNTLIARFQGKALRKYIHSAAVVRANELYSAPSGAAFWLKIS